MNSIEEAQATLAKWAEDRGIIQHSNVRAQALKLVSEVGELADDLVKGNDPSDSLGDVLVCLCMVAEMSKLQLSDCLSIAWNQIKDRKGRMVEGGAFVKE